MNMPFDNAQDDRDALEKHGHPSDNPESEADRDHPPPCNWDGGANCICPPAGPGRIPSDVDVPPELDHETGEVPFEPDETPSRGYDSVTRSLTSMDGMAWAARKYRETEEAIGVNARAFDAEVGYLRAEYDRKCAEAADRTNAANKPFQQGRVFFESLLTVYATQNRAEVLKGLRKDAKSRPFPGGVRIGWRKDSGGYRWDDGMKGPEREAALLKWAEGEEGETGDPLTRAVLKPDLDAIKAHLAALDDEDRSEALAGLDAPPGLKYVEPGEALEITFSKEKP